MDKNHPNKQKQDQIIQAIDFARGMILDSMEIEIGQNNNWKHLRSRILKIMGDRGLEGNIKQILDT